MKEKLCDQCGKKLNPDKSNIWINKKNVCEYCFKKLKKNGNGLARGNTIKAAWMDFMFNT